MSSGRSASQRPSTAAGAAALALVVLVAAACTGGDGREISASRADALVLQPADLGPRWTRFDAGQIGLGEQPGGERSDPGRFGRIGGWKARYRRGAVVVESRADLFGGRDGAARELELARDQTEATVERLTAPEIGAEAHAGVIPQGSLRVHVVTWRDVNVVATIIANGKATELSFDDALALARKQQERIAAASG